MSVEDQMKAIDAKMANKPEISDIDQISKIHSNQQIDDDIQRAIIVENMQCSVDVSMSGHESPVTSNSDRGVKSITHSLLHAAASHSLLARKMSLLSRNTKLTGVTDPNTETFSSPPKRQKPSKVVSEVDQQTSTHQIEVFAKIQSPQKPIDLANLAASAMSSMTTSRQITPVGSPRRPPTPPSLRSLLSDAQRSEMSYKSIPATNCDLLQIVARLDKLDKQVTKLKKSLKLEKAARSNLERELKVLKDAHQSVVKCQSVPRPKSVGTMATSPPPPHVVRQPPQGNKPGEKGSKTTSPKNSSMTSKSPPTRQKSHQGVSVPPSGIRQTAWVRALPSLRSAQEARVTFIGARSPPPPTIGPLQAIKALRAVAVSGSPAAPIRLQRSSNASRKSRTATSASQPPKNVQPLSEGYVSMRNNFYDSLARLSPQREKRVRQRISRLQTSLLRPQGSTPAERIRSTIPSDFNVADMLITRCAMNDSKFIARVLYMLGSKIVTVEDEPHPYLRSRKSDKKAWYNTDAYRWILRKAREAYTAMAESDYTRLCEDAEALLVIKLREEARKRPGPPAMNEKTQKSSRVQ